MNSQQEGAIAHALVTNPDKRWAHLYHTNALFHANIDALAKMLPLWVDGIAKAADEHQTDYDRHLQDMRMMPAPMFKLSEAQARQIREGKFL